MAKNTLYFSNPHRKLNQLLNDLSQNEIDSTNKHLKDLLNKKKSKLREIYSLSSHDIIQPKMVPAKFSHVSFMESVPMAVVEEFTDEKVKANILKPDRFYSSQPNVKAGSFSLPKKASLIQNRRVVNAEFEEYNRVVDEQSGEYKHKKILKLLSLNDQMKEKSKYSRMKKTLFQKFLPDKYNFYENPLLLKKSTTFESSNLKRSQSKYLRSEQSFDNGELRIEVPLSTKQIRTMEISQQLTLAKNTRKTSILSKSRLKINGSQHQIEKKQKNINNIQ